MIRDFGVSFNLSYYIPPVFNQKIHFSSYISPIFNLPRSSISYSISFLRIPFGLYYLYKENFKNEHTLFGSLGNLLLIPADIGGSLLLIGEIAIPTLASAALGFGIIAISVATIYLAGYIAIGINSFYILTDDSQDSNSKRQAIIDLSNAIVQIALAAFFIVGYSSFPILVTLGILGAILGTISFCHRTITSLSLENKVSEV